MNTPYTFGPASPNDARAVFALTEARVHWMDRVGIRQWNTTDYLNVYPLAYYERNLDHLYVLRGADGRVAAAAMLPEWDERWNGNTAPALYVHNLVSAEDCPGAGAAFLQEAERLALRMGRQALRLDSADDNAPLAAYYERRGFLPCGTCSDGAYHGILREKRLVP